MDFSSSFSALQIARSSESLPQCPENNLFKSEAPSERRSSLAVVCHDEMSNQVGSWNYDPQLDPGTEHSANRMPRLRSRLCLKSHLISPFSSYIPGIEMFAPRLATLLNSAPLCSRIPASAQGTTPTVATRRLNLPIRVCTKNLNF